ncbi:MAG: tetrathionate reductase family octaheme c-type cytochrome [Xanthomonadales bacterium]|nr:tetrathionate reductase family octaheme c-type cytochrome [Xanthomonadales bacterium]
MKLQSLTANRAVPLVALAIAFSLMVFPLVGLSKSIANDDFRKFEKSTLVTPADFIQHAASQEIDIHELFFELRDYEGTKTCLMCHEEDGQQMLDSAHFKWQGTTEKVVGLKGRVVGKNNLINNFCIATASNEARCTQCHAGYGYQDATYDFSNPENIDCLVCHDQSGTYKKEAKYAGIPVNSADELTAIAASIRVGVEPTRKACLSCHTHAGGGDNVKHGDISTDLIATTREYDVHMGTDGANMSCVDCHGSNHDPKTGDYNHGIAGMPLHSIHEGEMKQCKDCHGSKDTIHVGTSVEEWLVNENWHDRLACQVCHIPAIARKIPTKTEWYWEDAGDMNRVPVTDPVTGKPDYDKMKGTFVWGINVRPALRYANGMWNRKVLNISDSYDSEPIDLGSPVGDYNDPDAMIFPFKLMKGSQVVDPVNKTVMVPHLFGTLGGPNPYWGKWDWNNALIDGAAVTGQDYSGTYSFAQTEMLLSVNHEVAPATEALGAGLIPESCMDCHLSDNVDFEPLGWTGDPLDGGMRNTTVVPTENNSNLLGVKEGSPVLK